MGSGMRDLFRRILVPHDFSAAADRALEVAAGLARGARGRLLVLHVVSPLPDMPPMAPPGGVPWITPVDLVAGAKPQLEATVRRVLPRRGSVPVQCRVEVGDPAHRIVLAARRVDAIVMATQGRTGLGHLLIGSVAEKVVRHAPRPVLTLRAGAGRVRPTRRRRTRRAAR